ncbi:MAG: Gfo/Idh/MocA family oxidoreductase [Planctomycetes bacterium]|nr:Gfo/Idh/MocA family oxidoreductase [Planctomycetota bacterium]
MSSGRKAISRREFLSRGSKIAGGVVATGALTTMGTGKVLGANDRINMAVIGIRGRGNNHIGSFGKIPGVKIAALCDIDESVLNKRAKEVEKNFGYKPKTEYDLRKIFDMKDIDAVSIATPNHWHALATIWACQAGKHVYCEKPCSHNIFEGRKMIEAARKYKRIVEVGFQNRSIKNVRAAMKFLHDGGIGKVYMARGLCFKPRDSFGKFPDSPVPKGVHWDLWVGPAPMYHFNEGKFHYNWHWHWATGNGDTGNQGPHQFDIARWGLGQTVHPVKINSFGGYYKFGDVCSQETPNTQTSQFEYADGTMLEFGTRGLYTNAEDDIKIGNIFLGTEGWMHLNGSSWKTYMGRKNTPGPSSQQAEEFADPMNLTGAGGSGHFGNFITALHANDRKMLTCDVEVGFMSTCLPHLANASYRTGRELIFDGKKEKFVNDKEADTLLTRKYRKPYIVPDKV